MAVRSTNGEKEASCTKLDRFLNNWFPLPARVAHFLGLRQYAGAVEGAIHPRCAGESARPETGDLSLAPRSKLFGAEAADADRWWIQRRRR